MKALRSLSARKKRLLLFRQAAVLFFCVSALTFPLFADERNDLTAALKKAIPKYKSDGMDIAEISRLLDAGADPNGLYDDWLAQTFLIQAAQSNNVELARLLLDHGADPNAVRYDGRWPMRPEEHSAAFFGDGEITALFISYGARFDVICEGGRSPLRDQAPLHQSSAILILEWEQTHRPDFSASFKNRKDYLTDVLSCILDSDFLGDLKVDIEETYPLTENLLKAGADPAAPHKNGFPVAYLAVRKSKSSQFFIPLLIEYGAPIDAFNKYGETALYCAIAGDNIDLANFLLKRGADPNQKCKSGETALMAANSIETINLLINSGANPNLQDNKGKTALMKRYKHEFIRLLLKSGADPSIKDENGRTILHERSSEFLKPIFDDLISHGCKIDEPDNEGFTPLIFCAFHRLSEEVLFLLEKGANPNYRSPKGRTVLHEYLLSIEKHLGRNDVLKEQDKSVIAALLEAGTRPADKDNEGDSALITTIRISRKNANMAPLWDIVKKYTSAE
jgi:ankyrin repeat protein